MAEAPSLGDFFKAKSKKKVKASNLNKAEEKKTEEKKVTKSKEDDAWQEDEVVAATMKVEVAGKLMREEEKVEEDTSAPAWGGKSKKTDATSAAGINEKRYPTLAKSVGSSSINIDDGTNTKVNIATSKNVFAALEGDDDEEDGKKRPTEINPAMVKKKKGEFEQVALKREVAKYTSKPTKKKAKEPKEDEDDEDEEDEEEDEDAEEGADDTAAAAAKDEAAKKKASEKRADTKAKNAAQDKEEDEEEAAGDLAEDLKILVDLVASKKKYEGRKKLPTKDLPREELEEEKENKPKQQQAGGKKKKFIVEETDKKLAYADWD